MHSAESLQAPREDVRPKVGVSWDRVFAPLTGPSALSIRLCSANLHLGEHWPPQHSSLTGSQSSWLSPTRQCIDENKYLPCFSWPHAYLPYEFCLFRGRPWSREMLGINTISFGGKEPCTVNTQPPHECAWKGSDSRLIALSCVWTMLAESGGPTPHRSLQPRKALTFAPGGT